MRFDSANSVTVTRQQCHARGKPQVTEVAGNWRMRPIWRGHMGGEIARLLTPEVLIALGTTGLAAAGFTAAVFMYFMSRTARAGIEAAQSVGGKAVADHGPQS